MIHDGRLSDVALDTVIIRGHGLIEDGRLVGRLTGKVEFSNGGGIEFYADSLEAFLNSLKRYVFETG